jgi:sulfide:quinone oxidoreductase
MKRILILGGGFGGVAAAHALRSALPDDEIVVVDRRPYFMVGFRKTWALTGMSTLEEGQAPLAHLQQFGIQFVHGEIERIDPTARAAEVNGQRIEADAMIVALGAQLAPDTIPGFSENAHSIFDPDSIEKAAAALREMTSGRIVFGIFGVPYKCPPAPYEMAILTREVLAARGVQPEITIFSPQPMSLPMIGEAGCSVLDSRMSDYGIGFLANHKATIIEAGRVHFDYGGTLPFDLLFGVAPHKAPSVLADSGLLSESGWIKVNPHTLQTSFDGVYAVGDCVGYPMKNGQGLPKAGVFAEAEGIAVAERIAEKRSGTGALSSFKGDGYCFLEVGNDEAMLVTGAFLADPGPQVQLTEPSHEYLEQKWKFEEDRLNKWFGWRQ